MSKTENKYTLPVGTKRYRVEFCDEAEATRLATAEGWKDGDSLWDYIDPIANDAYVFKSFRTLAAATKYAKTIKTRDVYASPRIDELEVREEILDGTRFREWELNHHWLLEDGDLVQAA